MLLALQLLILGLGVRNTIAGPVPRYQNTTLHNTISSTSEYAHQSSAGPIAPSDLSSAPPFSSATSAYVGASSRNAASSPAGGPESPGRNHVFATGVRGPPSTETKPGGRETQYAGGENTRGTTTLTLYTTILPNKHVSTSSQLSASPSQAASYEFSSSASSVMQPSGASSDYSQPGQAESTEAANSPKSGPSASPSSSSPVHPLPDTTKGRHPKAASVTVDPVKPSGSNDFPNYSYSPSTTKRRRPHTPPFQPGGLPTIITQQPPAAGPTDAPVSTPASSKAVETSSSSSAIAGITIVPIDPDSNATTIYITVTTTTTDAGVTETATVTSYA